MSDEELVKRLLDFDKVTVGDARDAALRIEALTAKLATCEKYRDAYVEMDMIGTQDVRDLDAKLAKAVDALRGVMQHMPDYADTVWQDARATLAEIEGEKG
jgi:uncharacterized iron-regulated protein